MADYETIQKNRNIAVGIFVFMALLSLVWLVYKFGDLPVKVSKARSYEVFVQFPKAPGVDKGTPVRFCGYQIGKVTEVTPPQILEDKNTKLKYHQTLAIVSIDKKYTNIPENIEVKLMSKGFGSSYIELLVSPESYDPNDDTQNYLKAGDLLQGSRGVSSEFFPKETQDQLNQLAKNLSLLIDNTNKILGDQDNRDNIKKGLANIAEAASQATSTLKRLEDFSSAGINTSEQLSKTLANMRLILEKVNSGQGTAGKFINDGRLYENLLENTEQLQMLIEDLKDFLVKLNEKGIQIKL